MDDRLSADLVFLSEDWTFHDVVPNNFMNEPAPDQLAVADRHDEDAENPAASLDLPSEV
ncbi:MAG: hypothetical protein JWN86_2903 [Planctomycetota bacterium]|nr:hypothetical protein [Planctomycetota bacterium]